MRRSALAIAMFIFGFWNAQAQELILEPSTESDYIPNLDRGQKLYLENCAMCHGSKGMAETVTAKQLKQKPASIGDPELLGRLSPKRVYETLTKGIKDKGMPSYSHMSDSDRWDMAAYIFTLNYNFERPSETSRPSMLWNETRTKTDDEIRQVLKKRKVPDGYLKRELSVIRYMPQ